MNKDTFYFSHDYNVRNDEKIKRLIRKHGYLGYGLFWAIVEDLYNNANALRLDCDGIAFELRVDSELIKSILLDFDLFVFDNDTFGSLSVERRLEERNAKSVKARESAIKRWNNANAMRTQCDGNAIKERKGKEIKGNNIKDIESFIEFRKFEFTKYPENFISRLASDFMVYAPIVYTTDKANDQYKDFVDILYQATTDSDWIMQISRDTDKSKVRNKLTEFINYCLTSQCFRTEKYMSHYEFQKHFVNKYLRK